MLLQWESSQCVCVLYVVFEREARESHSHHYPHSYSLEYEHRYRRIGIFRVALHFWISLDLGINHCGDERGDENGVGKSGISRSTSLLEFRCCEHFKTSFLLTIHHFSRHAFTSSWSWWGCLLHGSQDMVQTCLQSCMVSWRQCFHSALCTLCCVYSLIIYWHHLNIGTSFRDLTLGVRSRTDGYGSMYSIWTTTKSCDTERTERDGSGRCVLCWVSNIHVDVSSLHHTTLCTSWALSVCVGLFSMFCVVLGG